MSRPLGFSKQLDAPGDRVWQLITDTRTWQRWGPSIRAVDCKDRYIHEGSKGHVLTQVGIWVPFVIVSFEPESYPRLRGS